MRKHHHQTGDTPDAFSGGDFVLHGSLNHSIKCAGRIVGSCAFQHRINLLSRPEALNGKILKNIKF